MVAKGAYEHECDSILADVARNGTTERPTLTYTNVYYRDVPNWIAEVGNWAKANGLRLEVVDVETQAKPVQVLRFSTMK